MPLSSAIGASSIIQPGVCTSTTRPASPYDGQVIYETDTNLVKAFDGTAFVTVGPSGVVQVKSTMKTDTFTMSTTTFTDVTGLSVSITPTSASNKILVIASLATGQDPLNFLFARLMRDSTAIAVGDTAGNRTRVTAMAFAPAGGSMQSSSLTTLDSPATTSAVTYKIQISGTGLVAKHVNRTDADTNNADHSRAVSTITVFEVTP